MNKKTILIIAGVVALGGVAFAGYKIWKTNKDKKDSNTDENTNFVEGDEFMVIDEPTFNVSGDGQYHCCFDENGTPTWAYAPKPCSEMYKSPHFKPCRMGTTRGMATRPSVRKMVKTRRFDGVTEGDRFNESCGI
jgi:hypothetical protein